MIPLTQAFEITDEKLSSFKLFKETIPIDQALGRTVIVDQKSRLELPPFDKSVMDGYAVLKNDERSEYRLLETVPAGSMPSQKLVAGTTIKVMTGAPVPEDAYKVIMVEKTVQSSDWVQVIKPEEERNIYRKGDDVKVGDTILRAPTKLGPLEIANLISAGIQEIQVARPPRTAILVSGDEIVDSFQDLNPGKIINSNGPMLEMLCHQHGLNTVYNRVVHDTREDTVQALEEALEVADFVIISGGVSVGDFDFVGSSLDKVGLSVHFNRVAVKPGKPMTFATIPGKTVAFGLPGNPVSGYLMFHLFVLRAVKLISGFRPGMRSYTLPLRQRYKRKRAARMQYVPCTLTSEAEIIAVEFHGSAHLMALLQCDGFFVVPQGVTLLEAGERVSFVPLSGSIE